MLKSDSDGKDQGRWRGMNVAWFLAGLLCGTFVVLVVAWLSIWIGERKQAKKYEIAHHRFIQAQVDWILSHQPSDEELKDIFSALPKAANYERMFENIKKGGDE